MTDAELDAAVARTRHERYRDLTSDANPDAWQREQHRAIVRRLAAQEDDETRETEADADAGTAPPIVPLATALRVLRVGHANCWYADRDDGCGCSGVRCRPLGRVVGLRDCAACLGLADRA